MSREYLSSSRRFSVLRRDKFTCQYCGRSAPHVELNVDHVLPVAKGGTNDPDNLVTACAECNNGKSDTLILDDGLFDSDLLSCVSDPEREIW